MNEQQYIRTVCDYLAIREPSEQMVQMIEILCREGRSVPSAVHCMRQQLQME